MDESDDVPESEFVFDVTDLMREQLNHAVIELPLDHQTIEAFADLAADRAAAEHRRVMDVWRRGVCRPVPDGPGFGEWCRCPLSESEGIAMDRIRSLPGERRKRPADAGASAGPAVGEGAGHVHPH